MIGELTTAQTEQLLHDEVIGRLGCRARGRIEIFPITYVYDGAAVYAQTGNGLKVTLMRENPSVCFEIDRLGESGDWQSVVVHGTFSELADEDADRARTALLQRIGSSGTPHGAGRSPVGAEPTGPRGEVMFQISILEKTGRFERVGALDK